MIGKIENKDKKRFVYYKNKKSNKIRKGWWYWIWYKNCFLIKIDGIAEKLVYSEKPEFDNWYLFGDR